MIGSNDVDDGGGKVRAPASGDDGGSRQDEKGINSSGDQIGDQARPDPRTLFTHSPLPLTHHLDARDLNSATRCE